MWYSKYDLISKEGSISCPNCEEAFDEELFYMHDLQQCLNCNSENIFVRNIRNIYVINLKKSPPLFKIMYEHLRVLSIKDAYHELNQIIDLFGSVVKDG